MPYALKELLEAAKEALEGALVYRGTDSPLWAAFDQAIAEIDKSLGE
jgi:hypothetical protein